MYAQQEYQIVNWVVNSLSLLTLLSLPISACNGDQLLHSFTFYKINYVIHELV